MRLDLQKCERAHAAHAAGTSLAQIARNHGVSPATAKYWVDKWARRLTWKRANPTWAWAVDVSREALDRLQDLGYRGRVDCMQRLGGDTIAFETWSVKRPRRDGWKRIEPVLWLEHVNEVRQALGVAPYVPPKRAPRTATPAQLKAAQRLLERHGYTVKPPPASS